MSRRARHAARRLAASGALAVLSFGAVGRLSAQGGLVLQGVADAELWATDTNSNLLTRNHGHPGGVGRLTLWSAVEPWSGVVVYAEGYVEGGNARDESGDFEAELDQLAIRYTRSEAFVLDVGKMPSLVGDFASRRFSTRNPLIGDPDGYPLEYPVGVAASGALSGFDYRLGVLSLPVNHPGYSPTPSVAPRPAAALGYTPWIGLRIGVSGTWGPYLNNSLTSAQLAGLSWQHFAERVGAADLEYSVGYLDVHGEYATSSYDVPGKSTVSGLTWYADAKYSLTPRLFVAARAEREDYPFIQPAGANAWVATTQDFHDQEAGLGFRLTASTLLKASYRWDAWAVTPATSKFIKPGGRALAMQLSQAFDVMNWLDRPH